MRGRLNKRGFRSGSYEVAYDVKLCRRSVRSNSDVPSVDDAHRLRTVSERIKSRKTLVGLDQVVTKAVVIVLHYESCAVSTRSNHWDTCRRRIYSCDAKDASRVSAHQIDWLRVIAVAIVQCSERNTDHCCAVLRIESMRPMCSADGV